MEEQLKRMMTECIVACIPQIAEEVVKLMAEQPHEVKTVTRQQGAKSLNVSLPTFDELIRKGIVRAKKVGRRVVVPQSEIENLLSSGEPYKYKRG